jgi:Arc/MetJ-type ribon-helix-helix transcriptional regulator
MSNGADLRNVLLTLTAHALGQLDELVRCGRFKDRDTAVVAAVARLYAEASHEPTMRQQAFARLCGALQIGTTRESLRAAEHDRLDWEIARR